MTNEITITRALTELKTLDKRIQKLTDSTTFISYEGQFYKPSEYIKSTQSNFQSIKDLIKRRKNLKSAIVTSNANTIVTINNENMTIAEAIETKSSIKHYKNLLAQMKSQYLNAISNVENINSQARRDLDGKLNANTKEGTIDVNEFSKKYIEMHGVKLTDPIKINDKIKEIENYIISFEDEVNYILTEKNSTTMINV